MAFDMTIVQNGSVAEITLSGELDANSATRFRQELEALAATASTKPTQFVLQMRELIYLASAGIRVLIVLKQQLFPGLAVCVVAPQPQVRETLHRTVHRSFEILDVYPAATREPSAPVG